MRREFLVSLILASVLLIPAASAQTAPNRLKCELMAETLCDSTGQDIMRLSAMTNAHGQIISDSIDHYDYVLCCYDSQLNEPIQGLESNCDSYGGLHFIDTALFLSAETNAHAQVPGQTPAYSQQVCLSVYNNPAVTDVDCIVRTTGDCPAGPDGYVPVVRLSAATNAHLEGPQETNYDTVICCRVGLDDTPPVGVSVDYDHGYHTSSALTVDVYEGTDPDTSITKTELFWRKGFMSGDGVCRNWEGYELYQDFIILPDGGIFPDEVSVGVESGTCYMFNYSSTNDAQLTATATSTSVAKVDTEPPVTTAEYEEGGVHGGDVEVPISCDDAASGCMLTRYCIEEIEGGGEPQGCSPNTLVESGEVTVTCDEGECFKAVWFRSEDNAGKIESTKGTGVIQINTELPTCEFTGIEPPEQGGYVNPGGGSIILKWEGSDPAGATITKYEITYKYGSSGSIMPLTTVDYPGPGEQEQEFNPENGDGQYYFYCKITNDEGDYSTSGAYDIFIDGSPPAMEISSPAWTNKGPDESFNVSWVADKGDGSPISNIVLTKDTGSGPVEFHEEAVTSGEGTAEYTLESDDVSITFQGTAFDKAGNSGDSEEVTTRVDAEPPLCSLDSLNEYQTHNSFSVSWSGTDAWKGGDDSLDPDVGGSILYTVQYSTDQSEWSTLQGADRTEATSRSMPGEDGETYYFRCMGEDAAGNIGEWSEIKSTKVDSSPPDMDDLDYISSIAKDEFNNISVKVSDAVGIESVVLEIDNEEIDPSVEDKDGNEWELVWYVLALDIGTKTARITVTDVNGNSDEETFNFTIKACIDGDVRECDPTDPDTGTTYSEGVCKHTGTRTCSGGMWGECTGGTFPSVEDCNELDDDCDGDVDESQEGDLLVKVCGTDTGICSAGLMTCIDGNWSSCAGEEGPNPEGEICGNSLDDDCDGVADEDCACDEGDTQPCGKSSVGECRFGIQTCENGKWSTTCAGSIDPTDEICTGGLDEDCDGYEDCYDPDCSLDSSCADLPPDVPGEPFPIGNILMIVGVVVMGVLLLVWYLFKRAGQELTWEALMRKWSRR